MVKLKRRHSLILLLVLSLLAFPLYAKPNVGLSLGYRNSSYFDNSAELDVHVASDNYGFGILTGFADYIRLSGEYTFTPVETLKIDLFSSYYHAYETAGGMAHLSFKIGQDLRFSWFLLNYRIGLLGGLGYSAYSKEASFSLSPDVALELGFALDDYFSLLIYLRSENFYETVFQSVPITGLKGMVTIGRHNIIFESYLVFADYMEGPTILIKDIVARIGYEVEL